METGVITFNLADRGRKHLGQPRNFNIQKLMGIVNGPATQERVKHRDMLGYYGHWPRQRFGMLPAEGGIAEGKAHAVEPALVTTYLQCNPDGTVAHKCEFLDTAPGQIAAKLYAQRVGGWSSAIDDEQNPRNFFGFDYVLNPNFSTNRGYALDSANGADGAAVLDAVAIADYNDGIAGTLALLDSIQANYNDALAIITKLAGENEELLSLLAKGKAAAVLDGGGNIPLSISRDPAQRMMQDIQGFKTVTLERIVVPPNQQQAEAAQEVAGLVSRMLGR